MCLFFFFHIHDKFYRTIINLWNNGDAFCNDEQIHENIHKSIQEMINGDGKGGEEFQSVAARMARWKGHMPTVSFS